MDRREFEELVSKLEGELSQIKSLFDQWVQGIERRPPMRRKDKVERALRQLRRDVPNHTGARYRFQSLWSRWTSLNTLWTRTIRQIEEGTHRRDVMRRRQQRLQTAKAQAPELDSRPSPSEMPDFPEPLSLDMNADFDFDQEVAAALSELDRPAGRRPSAAVSSSAPPVPIPAEPRPSIAARSLPPRPPPQARSLPPRPPPQARSLPPKPPPARSVSPQPRAKREGLTEGDVSRIYERYVEARRKHNQPTDTLSLAKMRKRLKGMEPKLREKHRGGVDFEVIVKDGRVGLKAVPKK